MRWALPDIETVKITMNNTYNTSRIISSGSMLAPARPEPASSTRPARSRPSPPKTSNSGGPNPKGAHTTYIPSPGRLTQPLTPPQEQSTTDIWRCICLCVRKIITESQVDLTSIRGIGFDATCSLAVFTHDTNEPVPVTGPDFANDGNDRNVILWLDHRPLAEAEAINKTGHNLLRYVGGTMSVEMEMPKVLWLKNHMPPDLFDRCKFYDLADALTHMATGAETRSFCSAVCKQGYVPVGVDGSVKGWQEDFYHTIGLGDLVEDGFKRMGGVDGVVSPFLCVFRGTVS